MKSHLSLLLLFLTLSVFSQENQIDCINTTKVNKQILSSDKSATVIWSEDFGGGFPAGWSTQTNNTGAGNNGATYAGNTAECPWKHSMQGSWGYWNSVGTNAAGNPTGPADPINSTTASNGFLISDIDSANHWNGNPGSNSGQTYHYIESYFITSAINTIGYPNVNLEFEQNFRFNNGVDLIVSVSSDSISWVNFSVQGNATNNQESADPELMSLNISCVAGDQSTVYIKIGWNARCYYWMLDDMRIIENSDNNLDIIEANYGGWYTTPTTNGFGLEYTHTPLNQATANPYTFEGIVTNNGGTDQFTKLNTEVFNDIGVTVFNTSSADSTILTQNSNCDMDTVTFVGNTKFTPTATGVYYFNTWASSPDTITNIILDEVIVTDSVYARDDDTDYSEYGLGRSCGGMIIGTYFDIYDTDNVTSLSVFIQDNSVVGSIIYVALYEIDTNNDKILITQSDDYIIQAADLGNWTTISFDNSINVSPQSYMAAVGGYQHPLDTTIIGMSEYTWPATCYIQKNGCLNSGQTYGNWYWLSRVPMIRINLGNINTALIYNNGFDDALSLFPNPSTGAFSLKLDYWDNDIYIVNILDNTGKLVYHHEKETNGQLEKKIDISSLGKGVYLVQVINSKRSIIEKITIY